MRQMLRDVPSLLWFALVFAALALWAEDVRGMYIAVACGVLGVIQGLRSGRPAGEPDADRTQEQA